MNILNQAFNFIGKIIVNLFLILLTIILNPFSALILFYWRTYCLFHIWANTSDINYFNFLNIFSITDRTTNDS